MTILLLLQSHNFIGISDNPNQPFKFFYLILYKNIYMVCFIICTKKFKNSLMLLYNDKRVCKLYHFDILMCYNMLDQIL